MKPACKDCRWWEPILFDGQAMMYPDPHLESKNNILGTCHKTPACWQRMDVDWCGEFEAKEPSDTSLAGYIKSTLGIEEK